MKHIKACKIRYLVHFAHEHLEFRLPVSNNGTKEYYFIISLGLGDNFDFVTNYFREVCLYIVCDARVRSQAKGITMSRGA